MTLNVLNCENYEIFVHSQTLRIKSTGNGFTDHGLGGGADELPMDHLSLSNIGMLLICDNRRECALCIISH